MQMHGKHNCQLVIQVIKKTWDRQMETNSSQPDGLLKEAGGYIYIYIYIYDFSLFFIGLHGFRGFGKHLNDSNAWVPGGHGLSYP